MDTFQKLIIGGALFWIIALSGVADAVSSNNTGNRIWDGGLNLSPVYTWTPQSFSGFYYDVNTGEGSENLTIHLANTSDRLIDKDDLIYETRPIDSFFKHGEWGKYKVIGFMAEKYFAGYSDAGFSDNLSLMADGKLSKVLMDSNETKSLYPGSSLILKEGYELEIKEVDRNGKKVLIGLRKDGKEIDTDLVGSNDDYTYKKDVGLNEKIVIIAVHLDNIFKGTETNAVFIDGIFQISDELVSINSSDSYGNMEVTSITSQKINMKNRGEIRLKNGNTIDIMGKLKFVVANDSTLRFAPMIEMSEPGNYELRGTVVKGKFKWTPMNFDGLYYNIDEGTGTESLAVKELDGRNIDKSELEYKSQPEKVSFEHEEWGKFEVIGFLADKYFAGYPDNKFSDGINLVSNGELAKVVIDSDEKKTLFSGSSLLLEEGYELKIREVDAEGNSVFLSLFKNDTLVDTDIVSQNEDYIYSSKIGSVEDVPLIVIHLKDIFRGTETNAVFIEGIFQISEECVIMETGQKYGIMEITDFSADGIIMENTDDLSLSRDKVIDVMGNIQFRVADSSDLRYYPFVEKNTIPFDSLEIEVPETLIEGETTIIQIMSRGGAVGEAVITVDGKDIGLTSQEGIIKYPIRGAGKAKIVATKEGFVSSSKEIDVIARDDETRKISIEISTDEVYEGDNIVISTVKVLSGEPVAKVELSYDGKIIGNTSDDGKLSYVVKDPGLHKIKTTPEGFLPAEYNMEVIAREPKFIYSGLKIVPIDPKTGENMSFSAEISNAGTATGEEQVELKINGSVIDSRKVILKIDESTPLDFIYVPAEAGTYRVQIGTEKLDFEVYKKSVLPYIGVGVAIMLIVFGIGYSIIKKQGKSTKKKGL